MIFITGHHDTGKSTLASFLVENNFVHVETSEIVRKLYVDSHSTVSFKEWANQNNHDFDEFIVRSTELARDKVLKENKQDVIITGNRQPEGIMKICQQIKPLEPKKNIIIYIESDPEILFCRHQKRPDRYTSELTFDRFQSDVLGYDKEMGVERIKPIADIIISNNCNISDLYRDISIRLNIFGYKLSTIEGQNFDPMRRR